MQAIHNMPLILTKMAKKEEYGEEYKIIARTNQSITINTAQ